MAVDAVIFDWGGTLTPWHDVDLLDRWRSFARVYQPERMEDLAQGLLRSEQARWAHMFETAGAGGTGALDAIFADNGVDTDTATFHDALAAYLASWEPNTWTDPDAAPLLEALRADGLKTAVLSNTMWPRSFHEDVLRRDGVLHLFDYLLFTSETASAKPHREVFTEVAENLGAAVEKCIFVGDRLFDDIQGAQHVGMRGVWIPHSTIPREQWADLGITPDATAQRLGDVLEVVRAWRSDG